MFYLIYVSSAVKLMKDDELLFLLQQSREKNYRLGITGILLYKDGSFMQMLEGEKQTVLELYRTIMSDERHKGLITVMRSDIKGRSFEDWSMGFASMDKVGDFPKYPDYIMEKLTSRSFQSDAQSAYRFMVRFHRRM